MILVQRSQDKDAASSENWRTAENVDLQAAVIDVVSRTSIEARANRRTPEFRQALCRALAIRSETADARLAGSAAGRGASQKLIRQAEKQDIAPCKPPRFASSQLLDDRSSAPSCRRTCSKPFFSNQIDFCNKLLQV